MKEGGFQKRKRGEGVVPLSSLFEKYKKTLKAPQGSVTQAFIEAVKEVLEVDVPKNMCTYKVASKTLCIHAPGPIKNEVLLNKDKILTHMHQTIGATNTPKNII